MKKHNFNVLRAAFEVLGKIYSKLVITRFTAKKNPGLSPRRSGGFKLEISVESPEPAARRVKGDQTGFNPNMESSYEGHTVNALVPTGDEGRDKLR